MPLIVLIVWGLCLFAVYQAGAAEMKRKRQIIETVRSRRRVVFLKEDHK